MSESEITRLPGTLLKIHDSLLEAERDLDLFQIEARGTAYWHLIRYNLFGLLLRESGLHGPRHVVQTTRMKRLAAPLRHPIRSYARRFSWSDIRPVDLLVFGHDRQELVDGRWQCPFTHDIVKGTGRSRLVIQNASGGIHPQPPAVDETRYIELRLLKSRVRTLTRPSDWRLDDGEKARIAAWVNDLGRRLGVMPSAEAVVRLVETTLTGVKARRRIYSELLDRTTPQCVLLVVHYGQKCLPLLLEARVRGIPVVEVQHGVIGPTHLAYNFAEGVEPSMFPDYFFGFGNWWREISPRFGLPAERFLPVGYPRLERQLARYGRRASPGQRTVVVISQAAVGESLSRVVVNVADRLKTEGVRVRYRMHPGEVSNWRARYPWLAASDVEVDDGGGDLYAALSEADVQVGVYSTAVYEGYAFGLPTVVIELPGHEGALPLVEAGLASTAGTEVELVRKILEAQPPEPTAVSSMWTPNAVENARAALEAILE